MLRTAGKVAARQYRRVPATSSHVVRVFSSAEGGAPTPRLVELLTKDEYVNFPRDKSVLYFTAKWCPPCRRIGPVFAEMSEETPSVSFGKVDIEDNDAAAKMAGIKSIPTFKFYKGGEEVEAISGADADSLELAVAKLAES